MKKLSMLWKSRYAKKMYCRETVSAFSGTTKKYIHEDIFSLPTQSIKKYRNYDRSIWMENIIDYDDDKHL